MGFRPVRDALQVDSMDEDLRVSLWNAVGGFFFRELADNSVIRKVRSADSLLAKLWVNFFKRPLDDRPSGWREARLVLRNFFFSCAWHEVYDFIEFVAAAYPQ